MPDTTPSTDDIEALAQVILPVLPNHCCEPGDVADCPWDAHDASGIARAVLAAGYLSSDQVTARIRAAQAEALESLADDLDVTWNRGHDRSVHPYSHLLRERADQIRARS
jgi:hypothetical protein